MPPLVVNFVPLGSKTPAAVLTLEGLLSGVRAQVVPQACPLREVSIAALYSAFVELRFLITLIRRKVGRTKFGMNSSCLSTCWLTVMPSDIKVFFAFLLEHLLVLGPLRVSLLLQHDGRALIVDHDVRF